MEPLGRPSQMPSNGQGLVAAAGAVIGGPIETEDGQKQLRSPPHFRLLLRRGGVYLAADLLFARFYRIWIPGVGVLVFFFSLVAGAVLFHPLFYSV